MPLKVCDFSSWRLSHLTPCQPHSGAMRATWTPMLVMGLVMLICTSAQGDAMSSKDEKRWFKRMMDIITQVENDAGDGSAQTDVKTERSFRQKLKTKSGEPILEIFPRDLRKKEKIIRHMTGPLYFSSKCRKRVYRLYHNTRDCTIPAYYKRCSRLLTNLARSPRCQEA